MPAGSMPLGRCSGAFARLRCSAMPTCGSAGLWRWMVSLQNRGIARATGVAALLVALLYAVGVVTGSLVSFPGLDASPSAVLRFSIAHRDGLLAAVVLNGIAWCA